MEPIPGSIQTDFFKSSNTGKKVDLRNTKITPQQFLGNAISVLMPKVGAIFHNRKILNKASQGDPTAIAQSAINVGGTMAGPAGIALIGGDQLMKKTMGQGVVEGWQDPRAVDAYSGRGLGGYGGLF